VAPDPTYANGGRSVDLLILKVTEGVDHPYLPFASTLPVEGQNVIGVGNPKEIHRPASSLASEIMEPNFSLLRL
jgi:hypothetical protein